MARRDIDAAGAGRHALVVTGRLNKQIADELGTSEKTIKIHRARIMQKMPALSVAELVRMADAMGMGESHAYSATVSPRRWNFGRPNP